MATIENYQQGDKLVTEDGRKFQLIGWTPTRYGHKVACINPEGYVGWFISAPSAEFALQQEVAA